MKIEIANLPQNDVNSIMREEFKKQSKFQSIFKKDFLNLEINNLPQAFRREVENKIELLGFKDLGLEDVHKSLNDNLKTYNFDDGVNKISQYFYDMNKSFYEIYIEFLKTIRKNFFDFDFFFQSTPTIRLHTPNSVNNNHYPRYHSDIVYGHPPQEINIWIPLTEINNKEKHGFKLINVEDSYSIFNQYDFNFKIFNEKTICDNNLINSCHSKAKDIDTNFGDFLIFDSRCLHTGMPLKYKSRASIDVRIIPKQDLDEILYIYQGKGRRKVIFLPGYNYHKDTIDNIT